MNENETKETYFNNMDDQNINNVNDNPKISESISETVILTFFL